RAGGASVVREVGARRISVVGADDPKLELRPRAGEDVEHQRRDRAIVVEAVSGLQLVGERTGIALVHGPNECFETLVARLELGSGPGQGEIGSSVVAGAGVDTAAGGDVRLGVLGWLRRRDRERERAVERLERDVGAAFGQDVIGGWAVLEAEVAAAP